MIETDKARSKLVSTEASAPVETPGAIPPLKLQADAAPTEGSRYSLDELVRFHDRVFVTRVYAALTGTLPSENELAEVLDDLRSGRRDKIEIIQRVLSTQSGPTKVEVKGLPSPVLQSIGRWPVVGYLMRLSRALFRLPLMLQHQQQFEAYTAAQQQQIADYMNDVVMAVNDLRSMNEQLTITIADVVDNTIMLSDSLVDLSARHAQLQTALHNLQSQLRELQTQRELSEKQLNTNLVSLTDAVNSQQQHLDGMNRSQNETAAAQREFLVQEQRVIVETQKAVLAEMQGRLDEFQSMYLRSGVPPTQEKRPSPRPTGSQGQTAVSGSEAQLATAESEPADEAGSLNLDSLYASFEDQFRGERSVIREQLKFYLPYVRAAKAGTVKSPILDVGCGRGEWLELLRDEGLHARGVDENSVLVQQCAARGLDVAKTDALTCLRALTKDSLSALTGFHIIEHLPFLALVALLDETLRVLRPGGLVILETPNPKNLVVGACNFYSDPTHQRPLFPETLQFLLDQRGFAQVRVEYLHPVDDSPVWQADLGAQALHGWFYGPRDFAVIGSKV